MFILILLVYCYRKGKHHRVRSQNQWGLTSVTWSLCLRWLVALLVSTMERPSIKLKLNLKWLVTILLNSQSLTSLLNTVGPVSWRLSSMPSLYISMQTFACLTLFKCFISIWYCYHIFLGLNCLLMLVGVFVWLNLYACRPRILTDQSIFFNRNS